MHQNKHQNKNKQHEPVLTAEVLQYLAPKEGESYLDLTAGYGGHARLIVERVGSLTNIMLVDRDQNAVDVLKSEFTSAKIRQQDFLSASQELVQKKERFDLILADLGVSSPHLNEGSRGFSINMSGPLDMRMDQTQELTAEAIVNNYSQDQLTDLLRLYGEEPKAVQIARSIVRLRPLYSTDELAAIAAQAWPGRQRLRGPSKQYVLPSMMSLHSSKWHYRFG
jgi:16S rRNA (cytosine1402-N4)-methyltransferase